ncbi:MAG: M20/M25/M40 family metallo-hydrolase, partial [Boseongicola sp.]|nr:M20/M25/M40 family metallo-hydrolase [Boseongicola sp.]
MSCDTVELTRQLVRCRTVTPEERGAIALLESMLRDAGFDCFRADRGGVANLVARWGEKAAARTFGFNGHADVVPPGDPETWSADPFAAEERDGWLYGRGAVD